MTNPSRRDVLRIIGGAAVLRLDLPLTPAPFVVGIGTDADPYAATREAVNAAGRFPAVSGRTVIVKPNLVSPKTWDTGITTHPLVTQAVVDMALELGASAVKIVEGGRILTPGVGAANFDACGYAYFRTYDPRVSLVDLSLEPATLTSVQRSTPEVPNAYGGLYLPSVVVEPGAVFISIGKLKTHVECGVTLATKNMFGLPPVGPYLMSGLAWRPRYQLHDRGIHQTIVDICLARPVDYAVIDGGIGMEGDGPVNGVPVPVGIVLAGSNHVAVDRVAIDVMQLPQSLAQHLDHASLKRLGPLRTTPDQVRVVGGTFVPAHPFTPSNITPPRIWYPLVTPGTFTPRAGQTATIRFKVAQPGEVKVDILTVNDARPVIAIVRTVMEWTPVAAGPVVLNAEWDGRDTNGSLVATPNAPTHFAVRVQSRHAGQALTSRSVNWVGVMP